MVSIKEKIKHQHGKLEDKIPLNQYKLCKLLTPLGASIYLYLLFKSKNEIVMIDKDILGLELGLSPTTVKGYIRKLSMAGVIKSTGEKNLWQI